MVQNTKPDMATTEFTNRELKTSPVGDPDAMPETNSTVAKIALLWDRRRTLLRVAVRAFVACTIVAFLIPPRYTSTTRLMPPDKSGFGAASILAALGRGAGDTASSIGSSIGSDLLGIKTSGDLFVGVLRSYSVENALIDKFDLRKVYWEPRYKEAREDLEHRTDITLDRKSGIITILVSDRKPQRAADMAREYVAQLNRIVTTLDTSSAHKERMFLEGRLSEVQQDLESAEKDFSQFSSKNTALDVKEQGKAMIGAAAQLEGQLIATETQLQGLEQIYTSNNVRVRALQARADELRRQMQKMGGQAPSNGQGAQPESNAGTAQESLYPTIRQLPILGVTWADLYRRTMVEEAVFETLTKQYELAKVEEARETPSVKVLDPADVPEKKSFPPRTLIVILGTLIVVICAAVWILAAARWQEIDPNDPGKRLATEIADTMRAQASALRSRFRRNSHLQGTNDGHR